MNTVDILLGLDNSVLEVNNTKEMEIKRLSKAAGKPFIVKLQGTASATRTASAQTKRMTLTSI